MALNLLPRQAASTAPPTYGDFNLPDWPDSCNFTSSLIHNCNLKFSTVTSPSCYNYGSDDGCCSSWGSYGSTYLSCLQTEYTNCPGLFATFVSEVESTLPCATNFPITSVPSLSFESISTGPPTPPPTHSPVTPYPGSGNLLQGYCNTPEYVLLDGPTAYWAPIVGCAGGKTDCCPYSVTQETTEIAVTTVTAVYTVTVDVGTDGANQGGYAGFQAYPTPISANLSTLAHCPADYQTVSGGCCPSGYQLWNAVLGGQVPCYSSLSSNLVPPAVPVTSTTPEFVQFTSAGDSAAGSTTISIGATSTTFEPATSSQVPTSAVVNIVFAVQYIVLPGNSGLSTGTKAGIGVGAGVGGIVIIVLSLLLVWRTRKHKKDKKVLAAIQAAGPNSTRQDLRGMSYKEPFVYSMRTELQSDDVNTPGQTHGNVVSQEQRGYYPPEQQQTQMQQGVQNPGHFGPQQGQYVRQTPAEISFHHQSPPPGSEGYDYQTGYAELATPGGHPQGYEYQPYYSTPQ